MDQEVSKLLRQWELDADNDGSAECWRSLALALGLLLKADYLAANDGMINARLAGTGIQFGVTRRPLPGRGVYFSAHS